MTKTLKPSKQTDETQITEHSETQAADATYKKRNKKPIVILLVAVLIASLLLLIAYGLLKSYEDTSTAPRPANESNGFIAKTKNKLVGDDIITLQGEVNGETVNLSTKLPSRIDAIYVKEGQMVKKGEILAKLISPEIEAKKQQADAALQSALAAQQATMRGTRQENTDSLYANWQSLQAQAKLAHETANRGEYLYQQGVISRQRRDEMMAAKTSSAEMSEAAHQQYLKAKHGRSDEAKSSADAQVQIAKAAVAEAQALDAETTLIAPIDGTINKIYAKPSELVAIAVPVISMIHPSEHVLLSVREDYLPSIRSANTLTGYIPALDKKVDFRISHIGAEGEFATIKSNKQTGGYDIRSFEVTLTPTTPIDGLITGMSVIFDIRLNR